MVTPRLTKVSISGFRSLRDVTLDLDGLSVLIGDNGSGKSSIIEVLEILRCTAHEGFVRRFASAHGGVPRLLEHGAEVLSIVATIDLGHHEPLVYSQSWHTGSLAPVEEVTRGQTKSLALRNELYFVLGDKKETKNQITSSDSLIFRAAHEDDDIRAVATALRGTEVHLPFRVMAHWATEGADRHTPRSVSMLEPGSHLARFGSNLVNAYQSLKNNFGADHWAETLEYVRLGLGHDIRDVSLEAALGGGHLALALETVHQGRVPAFSLADGVLSYLAWVALFRLDEGRTLLAFDEPELHLHPGLLARVLGMLESMSDRYPVVIATHSDRLLDGLTDPAGSVIVTQLDEVRRTCLYRLDKDHLAQWLDDYRGLGELRADGELPSVLADSTSSPQKGAAPPQ